MESHEIIKFQNIKFYTHPIYNRYSSSKKGQIFSKKHRIILKPNVKKGNGGYLHFFAHNDNGRTFYSVSRFVYECFKGTIPDDKEVDHIDNNKENNSIKNLQLLTHKENIRKAHCKKVKSFNIEIREEKKFGSIKEAAKYNCISPSSVCLNCKKITKVVKSKRDGMIYLFNYIE